MRAASRRRAPKSKREVEHLVACIDPKPDVAASVRRVPAAPVATALSVPLIAIATAAARSAGASDATPAPVADTRPRATVAPIAPERYLIKVTVGADTHAKLCRARDLLRHAIPNEIRQRYSIAR